MSGEMLDLPRRKLVGAALAAVSGLVAAAADLDASVPTNHHRDDGMHLSIDDHL